MKIAVISTFLGQKTSGAEISSFLLAKHLSDVEDIFIITTKVTNKMPCRTYSMSLTKFIPHNVLMVGTAITDFYLYKKILKILRKEKPDVMHIQDFSIMIPALKAAKKLDIPTVMTVRDFRFECNLDACSKEGRFKFNCSKEQYKKCLKETLSAVSFGFLWLLFFRHFYKRKLLLNNYVKKIDYFISVSNFVKDNLMKFGIDKDKITMIYVPKPDWKPRQEKHKNYLVLFSPGLLVKAKGFQTVVDAFDILQKKYKNIRLRIAGAGSYEGELRNKVKRLGLEEKVSFLSKISYEQVEEEYINSGIIIQPSIIPESLSRIIFESFSVGRPVVATNVGGTPELVKHGKTGLLVKPNDAKDMASAITKLIKDAGLREKLGKEGLKLINKCCNKKEVIKKHLKVYENVIRKTI